MSIKISDIAIKCQIASIGDLGTYILIDTNRANKSLEVAKRIFNSFIREKIPFVKNLLGRLTQLRNISEVHVALPLFTIFFLYLDELVEHCQGQLEERNKAIDEQVESIKCLFALGQVELWNKNLHQLENLFNELKNQLTHADVLPTDFDQIIPLWVKILKIQYV